MFVAGAMVQSSGERGMPRALQAAAPRRVGARQLPVAAAVAALGIVYGDIGTSPLYAFKQAAAAGGALSPNSRIKSPAVIIPAIGFRSEGRLRYCCLGVFPANPARRNASAIASPLAGTGLLRPARVSADRKRFSDSVGGISARAVDGRASRA